MATFQAGGELILSYTNGTDRWEIHCPVAQFDPATFRYTGTGLKAPTETDLGETFAHFGSYWAPYFDPSWTLSIEAVFWSNGGTAQRLSGIPVASPVSGTSSTPSSSSPPLMRGFSFQLDNGLRARMRLYSIATDIMGPRRAVSATSGGFDARDQALVAYLAGPATGLVAWDGQVFPPIADAYQRFKLRPFERPPATGPAGDCVTFPRGATLCNPATDRVTLDTPGGSFLWDRTGMTIPGGHRLEQLLPS